MRIPATLLTLAAVSIALCAAVVFVVRGARQEAPLAAAYYVSIDGSDSNPGTSAAPWRTIQKAADTLKAGETAIVAAGLYPERVHVTNSGGPGALISFVAQGAVSMHGFRVSASFIKIDGFEIANVAGDDLFNRAVSSGIYSSGANDVFTNLYIHGTNAAGIYLTDSSTGNILNSNRIVSAVEAGIYVQGSDHLIESNDISHTVQKHSGMVNSADADGIRFFGSGSIFRKNYIHDITLSDEGNVDAHIDAFQTWGPFSDITIERNTILQMESPTQGIIIEGMHQPAQGITIRNNVFMTKGTGYAPAVLAGDGGRVSDVMIVNNTIVALNGPAEYAIWLFGGLRTAVVRNNAIFDHGNSSEPYIRVDTGAAGLSIGGNSISKSDGKQPRGTPYPGDIWMVNPQFADLPARDFRLKPTSPLIDAGISLPYVADDFDGNPRPRGRTHDIGAFETRWQ